MTGTPRHVNRPSLPLADVATFVVRTRTTSAVALCRRFHIGHRKASELLQLLEDHGILGHRRGDPRRVVLVDSKQLAEVLESLAVGTEGESS